MHLLVDTSFGNQLTMGVKAFQYVEMKVAETLLQYREVPLQVQTSIDEKAGISQLMQARRATREATKDGIMPKDITDFDGFTLGLKELLSLFRRMQEYVRAVQEGKVQGDLAVGRGLTAQLCAEPVIDQNAVETLCNRSLQDALMVVHLSNLTRTQIALAEKIQALYGDVGPQNDGFGADDGPRSFGGYEDRPRRDTSGQMCRQFQAGNCAFGDRCRFSHG